MDKAEILRVFDTCGTDKGSLRHGYHQMYADVFESVPVVSKLLEIGVKRGRSLAAWLQLLPHAEIIGVDTVLRDDIILEASFARIIVANSTRKSIAESVGSGYDIIIDDGDHRPDSQWQTFLNLEECWTKVYVIEDIIGIDAEKVLRKRLNSKGYTDIQTFSSKESNVEMSINGKIETFSFYSIVVHKK